MFMVGNIGFEPMSSCSQHKRDTKLRQFPLVRLSVHSTPSQALLCLKVGVLTYFYAVKVYGRPLIIDQPKSCLRISRNRHPSIPYSF